MINDVVVKDINILKDDRGSLTELFRQDELVQSSLPVMGYESMTLPNVVRGPHEHHQQSDLFIFSGPGDFELHLWDNRIESQTFGTYSKLIVGQSRPCYVIIPPGVVHGYKNISDVPARSLNFPNKLYKGKHKTDEVDEIRHESNKSSKFKIL